MSDYKLCPMRKCTSEEDRDCIVDDFLPCVQEKCAWWIEAIPDYEAPGPLTGNPIMYSGTPGHCVALDWGKP
ncbi:MAG: hypothetical protein PHC68_02600 [Syntrophorhabdaceae bacterium]|nr:hypothetical protein [Syntrophorhabdaceae bacterium]